MVFSKGHFVAASDKGRLARPTGQKNVTSQIFTIYMQPVGSRGAGAGARSCKHDNSLGWKLRAARVRRGEIFEKGEGD